MTQLLAILLTASPDAGVLVVDGAHVAAKTFTKAELEALGAKTATFTDKRGEHTVVGVPLEVIVKKAGFVESTQDAPVAKDKHPELRTAVIARASDGFEAVFSIGELLADVGATQAFVIWQWDGKPLPESMGQVRLVVPTDKRGARSIYQLTRLTLVDLRSLR